MGVESDRGDGGLPPDEAFGVLGNETRVQILQALGEADGPVSFTALRDQVGVSQGRNFNYHLEKVVGHFVSKQPEGYVLRQPGRRVVQAVLSGAVTDDPELACTRIDEECWWCGAPIVVSFHQERLDLYCTRCEGTYGDVDVRWPNPSAARDAETPVDAGFLGTLFLPAAGIENRTPADAYRVAMSREMLDYMAVSLGVCPRCAGEVDTAASVCKDHDTVDGLCEQCGNRKSVHLHVRCENCIYESQVTFVYAFYADTEFVAFLTDHGISPFSIDPGGSPMRVTGPCEEDIRSTDPFCAEFSFAIDDETLTLTVDEDFDVVDCERTHSRPA